MFEFKLPDISQNQLLQSGLGLLSAGRNRGQNPFLAVAQGLQSGRAQDKAAEDEKRQAELFEMQRAEMARTQQQQQRWDAMFQPPGGGQAGSQYAQAGGPTSVPGIAPPVVGEPGSLPGMINLPTHNSMGRTPGIQPQPGGGQAGPQYAQAEGVAPAAGPTNLLPPGMQPQPAAAPSGGMLPAAFQNNPQAMAALQNLGPQAGGRFLLEQMFKKQPERRIVKGADGFSYFADTQERVLPGVEARDPKLLSSEAQAQAIERARAGKGETTIQMPGDGEFGKASAKSMVQTLEEGYTTAGDAVETLRANNEARQLIKSGMITGTGAEWRLRLGQVLQEAGIDLGQGDAIANTQAYFANRAKAVANMAKNFGSGAGITEADREFAERASGGQVDMTKAGLERILDMGDKMANYSIERYNQDVVRAQRVGGDEAAWWEEVQAPSFEQPQETEEDSDLPPGFVEVK